ncbi:MAG: DUF1080 domain-containing protein [Bacteroidetes bacterium]|nr:MAG: DUF1080 domain-containing protein [Bacteroidota bacterium]
MFKYLKTTFLPVLVTTGLFLIIGCGGTDEEAAIERPNSPWVFRSVLDETPRIVTVALNDNLWVAYSTQNASLFKAWKGTVNFDGAVYTTVHGPQPTTVGDFWMVNAYDHPWSVVLNGQTQTPKVQYRGHRFEKGHVWLNYELALNDGTVIRVSEQPEYTENTAGAPGFERRFKTSGVPDGAQVVLNTNVQSVAMEQSVETDGTWTVEKTEPRTAKNINGVDLSGTLALRSNGETVFTAFFTKNPLIDNPNKVVGAEVDEALPEGYRLIARNDCKTCHNSFVQTVGPSYQDVAKRYMNTPENVEMLVAKVKNGGAGVWGDAPMTPHPDVPEEDIRKIVEYIMEMDAEAEAELAAVKPGNAPEDTDFAQPQEGVDDNQMFPGGLLYVYTHDYRLHKLADVNADQPPAFEAVIPSINLQAGDLKDLPDNSAIYISGYLKIPASSNYVFRLISDDGSKLWIDDQLVIDLDGEHGADPRDGEMALAEGYHPFKIEYFQSLGGKMLEFRWRPYSATEFSLVPATVIVHNKNDRSTNAVTMGGDLQIPGDGTPLLDVHPAYDLSQARPDDFLPKVGGLDFLSDGRLVVCTWDAAGSVYIVEGVEQGDPAKIKVKRIAQGLAEPLGLKVVDDEIYVLQKQELTKLIDHTGDEIIDEYQTVCNSWTTTANFHEFAFGLAYKDGWFYGNTAIAIMPGGASASPQAPDRGKTFRISKETGEIEFVAHGLRTPNGIGLGVDNEVFVADNQGDWLPSSKILHITKGAFFNSHAVDPEGTKDLPVKQPVVWLPQDEIGNSPSTPLALNDGPYAGQMIHGEVTHGGVKRVFVEKVNGEYQGCVFRFIQGLEAGINRMAWGPDGALYVGGIGSTGNWQQYGKLWYGLQRLKYNGKPVFEMLAVRAKSNGMEIEFTEPLPEGTGWNPAEYEVKQWWYLPTENYGGPKMDEETLPVKSATVSDDRRKVFLELDGLKPQHVVYIHIPFDWVSADNHELWATEAWYTLNNIPENNPGIVGQAPQPIPNNTLTDAEKAAGWKLLFDGKTTSGWRNFKKQTIGKSWRVEDGTLTLAVTKKADGGWQAEDGGDIITEDEYQDFELNLEWKIQPCGNSGIIYYVVESDEYDYVWNTGPEMQILDNACHADAKIEKHRAGDLYDLIECKYVTVRPAGQWNKVRIVSKDGHVEHWLNGRKVVEFQMHTPEWNELIQNSKFKTMPGFGQAKKGHISLQDHGDRVWFRNIKIREL